MKRLRSLERSEGMSLCLIRRERANTREQDKALWGVLGRGGRMIGWDLTFIEEVPDAKIMGNDVPAHERLPGLEHYGTSGWYFMASETASAARKWVEL